MGGGNHMEERTKAEPTGWGGYRYFLGLDWAQAHHAIVVLAPDGQKALDLQIALMLPAYGR